MYTYVNIDYKNESSWKLIYLGVYRSSENKTTKKNDSLGQEDFLKLMTTQLQNQDPFSPMENGDFIAQMAQFSTVTGITEMSESLKSLSGQLGEFRIATASSMLGNSVLVHGNIARPDANGEIHGVIDMPVASSATNVSFSNNVAVASHSPDKNIFLELSLISRIKFKSFDLTKQFFRSISKNKLLFSIYFWISSIDFLGRVKQGIPIAIQLL